VSKISIFQSALQGVLWCLGVVVVFTSNSH